MKIRHLKIERFRGIRELDWRVMGDFICLIGPGDSTKSTVLDALELALSSRWDYNFDDADFFDSKTEKPIIVTVTVSQLPETLIADGKFGRETRGWNKDVGLHDEPQEGDELALSIRLKVDSSLEAAWAVVNDRNPEGRTITARDRQLLGVIRLGSSIDRHLTWNDGTVLSRLTGEVEELPKILAEAGRAARTSIKVAGLPILKEIAQKAQKLGEGVGVAPMKEYSAGLDLRRVNFGVSGIALHDGDIPLRRAGSGTRRLLTVALQREIAKDGGVTIIDELESGLEPHRIRSLIEILRPKVEEGEKESRGQVVVTTHSPIVIVTLNAACLKMVRSHDGITMVTDLDASLQNVLRGMPEAFLGRRIIVCEGKTEIGVCQEMDRWWARDGAYKQFGYHGVVPVLGNGEEAAKMAVILAKLDYEVAFFGDSDKPISPDVATLQANKITVFQWADNCALEERLSRDLPWKGLLEILECAIKEYGEQSVFDSIQHALGSQRPQGLVSSWVESPALRIAIGKAAKSANGNGWFKRISLGEDIGRIICKYLENISTTDLAIKLSGLRTWVMGNGKR